MNYYLALHIFRPSYGLVLHMGEAVHNTMFFDGTGFFLIRSKWSRGRKIAPLLPPGLAYKGFKHGSPHVSAHLWAILRGEHYHLQVQANPKQIVQKKRRYF